MHKHYVLRFVYHMLWQSWSEPRGETHFCFRTTTGPPSNLNLQHFIVFSMASVQAHALLYRQIVRRLQVQAVVLHVSVWCAVRQQNLIE